MKNLFTEKSFLITGGTGSSGNAVLHRILNTDIKEIHMLMLGNAKLNNLWNGIK
jgi:UDP-N-acetylglucosamine 4,6-dehydratase/5-epimerase